jgi:hypothetical protein
VVVVARPEWVDWVARHVPSTAAAVAVLGVVIAACALYASLKSAAASRESADNSTAALAASVAPVLTAEYQPTDDGALVRVTNVGKGAALNVRAHAQFVGADNRIPYGDMGGHVAGVVGVNAAPAAARLSVYRGSALTALPLRVIVWAESVVDRSIHWTLYEIDGTAETGSGPSLPAHAALLRDPQAVAAAST